MFMLISIFSNIRSIMKAIHEEVVTWNYMTK